MTRRFAQALLDNECPNNAEPAFKCYYLKGVFEWVTKNVKELSKLSLSEFTIALKELLPIKGKHDELIVPSLTHARAHFAKLIPGVEFAW